MTDVIAWVARCHGEDKDGSLRLLLSTEANIQSAIIDLSFNCGGCPVSYQKYKGEGLILDQCLPDDSSVEEYHAKRGMKGKLDGSEWILDAETFAFDFIEKLCPNLAEVYKASGSAEDMSDAMKRDAGFRLKYTYDREAGFRRTSTGSVLSRWTRLRLSNP